MSRWVENIDESLDNAVMIQQLWNELDVDAKLVLWGMLNNWSSHKMTDRFHMGHETVRKAKNRVMAASRRVRARINGKSGII